MKFEFKDKSFLQLDEIAGNINIVMCGKRDHKSVVMSSYTLTATQVEAVVEFLNEFLKKGK
jgi:hypothetical protein